MRVVLGLLALLLVCDGAPAAERPDWAFPPPPMPRVAIDTRHDDGLPKSVPGSARLYTQKQIDSFNDSPDWFPEEHPPMPTIVAHGKGSVVRACIACHLATGHGHPENSRLPGSSAGYLAASLLNSGAAPARVAAT